MFNFHQKFICIYNMETLQHYIVKMELDVVEIEAEPICTKQDKQEQQKMKCVKSNLLNNNFKHGIVTDIIPKVEPKNSEEAFGCIELINYKKILQHIAVDPQECSTLQIYLSQLDRYCSLKQLSQIEFIKTRKETEQLIPQGYSWQDYLPYQFMDNQVILLRFCPKGGHNKLFYQNSYPEIKYENVFNKARYYKKVNECVNLFNSNRMLINQLYIVQPNKNSRNQTKLDIVQTQGAMKPSFEDIRQRDRNRTIHQIMQFVKKWRYLADQGYQGKKLNLQEAAHYVGIPKKSLDDYYYQLRVGEQFGFDFQNNLMNNISVLRKFVKQKRPKRKKGGNGNQSGLKKDQGSQCYNVDNKQEAYEKSNEAQHKDKINDCINKEQRLPKCLKYLTKKRQTQRFSSTKKNPQKNQIITLPRQPKKQPQAQASPQSSPYQDNKISRLSDSEVSSISNIWPNINQAHSVNDVFDDQDSFFNEFKYGNHCSLYGKFDYLCRNEGDAGGEQDKSVNLERKRKESLESLGSSFGFGGKWHG